MIYSNTSMPKKRVLLFAIILLLVLVGFSVYLWNNYQLQVRERPIEPIKLPPAISGKCAMENCHGLEITCGPNVAEVCDMMYLAGDNCRQYASCQVVSGKCQLVKNEKFNQCKSCVEKCSTDFKDDQVKFFECESKCSGSR